MFLKVEVDGMNFTSLLVGVDDPLTRCLTMLGSSALDENNQMGEKSSISILHLASRRLGRRLSRREGQLLRPGSSSDSSALS